MSMKKVALLILASMLVAILLAPVQAANQETQALDGAISITGITGDIITKTVRLPDFFYQKDESGKYKPVASTESWQVPCYPVEVGATVTNNQDMAVFFPYYLINDSAYPGEYRAEDSLPGRGNDCILAGDVLQEGFGRNGYMSGEGDITFTFDVPGLYIIFASDNLAVTMGMEFFVSFQELSQELNAVILDVQGEAPTGIAYPSAFSLYIDEHYYHREGYALRDTIGNSTNYISLRDLANDLNGTAAQFDVSWDGSINIETGKPYTTVNGTEGGNLLSGRQPYALNNSIIKINGQAMELEAIVLTDANGNGYTYFKLRDLGQALGFNVSWNGERQSIMIDTSSPYSSAD